MIVSVFPRGNIYYVDFKHGDKVIRKSTRVTLTEGFDKARRVAEKIVAEYAVANVPKGNRIRLKEAIEEIYKLRWQHLKDSEMPYERSLFILHILGNLWVDEITTEKVNKLQEALLARGMKTSTVNRYLSVLSTIVTDTEKQLEKAVANPRPLIRKFKEPEGRIRYLTRREEQELLSYLTVNGWEDYADLFACLIDTGFRFSELNDGVTFDDINWSQNYIHCWRNKGDRPRTVPMTDRVRKILRKRQQISASNKPFGLNYWTAHRLFNEAKHAMGLAHDRDFCIHALRHTCASRLVQAGISLYVVQKILGHSSIQVTEKYAHLNTGVLNEAIKVLNTD